MNASSNSIKPPAAPSPVIARCIRAQLQNVWNTMTPDEHIKHVDKLLRQRRLRNEPVAVERRGRNP
jgi:hypothetical protein